MKNTLTVSAVIIALAVVAMLVQRPNVTVSGNPATTPALGTATTTAAISVTSSTRILATTSDATGGYSRSYATVCNPNANPVYIRLGQDKPASATAATFVIAAAAGYQTCFEITPDRLVYNGSITASSTNQTATTVFVSDYVF